MAVESIVLVENLISATAPWRSLYNNSAPVEMSVIGTHVLSMFVAGGLAISHDRGSLRAAGWNDGSRKHHIAELHAVHRVVIAALAICILSGLALFASDIKTYVVSIPFWVKMALIVALFANALVMTASETTLRAGSGAAAPAWSRIRISSIASMTFWGSIVIVSIILSLSK